MLRCAAIQRSLYSLPQPLAWPVLVLLGGLVLYGVTVAPTVLWGDDAELQRIVVTGEQRTIGQSGEASHLLWLAVTRAFVGATGWLPLDAAGRTNLVSALAAAAALPFVYGAATELARQLGQEDVRARTAGVAAAAAFAVSHTFWLLAVRPDVYTLQTALLACATWAVLRWRRAGGARWVVVAALASLAALLNHIMIVASGPGLAALALSAPRDRRRTLPLPALSGAALAAAALGLAALGGVPVGALVQAGGSAARPQLPSARDAALFAGYLVYQFPLTLPLALVGAIRAWRRDRALLAALTVLYAGSALLMLLRLSPIQVRDQYLFYLPSYVPVALLIGVGAADAVQRITPLVAGAAVAAPLVVYPVASVAAGSIAARLTPARQLLGRDPAAYYLLPPKTGYDGARRFADAALAALAPNAVVVSDWLPYQTLLYAQRVERARPDVRLEMINAGNGAQLGFLLEQQRREPQRPLYLADDSPHPYYEIDEIRRCFATARDGPMVRLRSTGACPG